jgi:hypothetical protein
MIGNFDNHRPPEKLCFGCRQAKQSTGTSSEAMGAGDFCILSCFDPSLPKDAKSQTSEQTELTANKIIIHSDMGSLMSEATEAKLSVHAARAPAERVSLKHELGTRDRGERRPGPRYIYGWRP